MDVTKCNRCKKMIKDQFSDYVSLRIWNNGISADFCSRCSPAFLRFLERYAKIKEDNRKK